MSTNRRQIVSRISMGDFTIIEIALEKRPVPTKKKKRWIAEVVLETGSGSSTESRKTLFKKDRDTRRQALSAVDEFMEKRMAPVVDRASTTQMLQRFEAADGGHMSEGLKPEGSLAASLRGL